MDRESLRNRMLSERRQYTRTRLEEIGMWITRRIVQSDAYRHANVIHCFSGATGKGEISTRPILLDIIDSGKKLVMPRVGEDPGMLEHYPVTDITTLRTNAWGIHEPMNGVQVSPQDLDLVLVPGLAVDREGNRIGYGKGYYDRFLARTSAIKLILVPDAFLLDRISALPHDIPMDAAATEKRWLNFHGNI